jgi:serine/threonine protein phosphatase 1
MWNKWSLRARGGGMSLTYAIADLHGRFDLLMAAFDAIVKHAAERSFKIIALGDYVDRGPQSRQIIDHLMAAQEMGVSLICLKGNHEDMMVETLRKPLHPNWWIENGGGQTLISYGHERSSNYTPEVVPEDHIVWLENLPLMHIDVHRIFVHAGVDRFKPLDQQDSQVLFWKLYDENDEGGHDRRHVVHGHHQFEDGPIKHPGRTDLDTFAWYTGRLVVGVFDDEMAGGPIDCIEVIGPRASLDGEAA